MHLFKANILLYLSFNGIGYLFMFISIMGTPGILDENKPGTKLLLKVMNILLVAAWKGMPYLLIASVIAFYFRYDLVGKVCSITALSLGFALLVSQIGIYRVQARK